MSLISGNFAIEDVFPSAKVNSEGFIGNTLLLKTFQFLTRIKNMNKKYV